jgi:hypothetical protein
MLHKGTPDGPRHQPFIDHSAVFSLLTSVARSVELGQGVEGKVETLKVEKRLLQ